MGNSSRCPKCDGDMETGWLADNAYHSWRFLTWSRGVPQVSWLGFIKTPSSPIPVRAYRCQNCGYLEMYTGGNRDTGPSP